MKKIYDNSFIKMLSVICILTVVVMTVVLIIGKRQINEEFTPPPFDVDAIEGIPTVSLKSNWQSLDTGFFSASVCTDVFVDGEHAEIMLYNPSENNCFLKLRMLGAENSVVAETGLIRPGEYIPRVFLESEALAEENAVLKIMAYEPDTYYSAGAVSVNVSIHRK